MATKTGAVIIKRYSSALALMCFILGLSAQDTIHDYPVWAIPEGKVTVMASENLEKLRSEYYIDQVVDTIGDIYRCSWSDIEPTDQYVTITTYPGDQCRIFVYGSKMGLGFVGKDMPQDEPRNFIGAWRATPFREERHE